MAHNYSASSMNIKVTIQAIGLAAFYLLLGSCNNSQSHNSSDEIRLKNEGHRLVYEMVNKVGNMKLLYDRKDVTYTYTYMTPDGKTDISNEKYIFNGELSYGHYLRHDRTMTQLEGVIEQGYDGKEYWLKQEGKLLIAKDLLKQVSFNRPTNFYWFTMMQKLLDDGLQYEHLGEKTIKGEEYNVVKVSFEKKNDKPTDIYQLYINKKTLLVDQFLFTVADFGKMDTPFLMELEYEQVDGLSIPTIRKYKQSTWNADVSDLPWIEVKWSNIKFNNGLTQQDFDK